MDTTLAQQARRLAEQLSQLSKIAAALADEAVFVATRSTSAQEVARSMGVSVAAVRKAVRQHNARIGEGQPEQRGRSAQEAL